MIGRWWRRAVTRWWSHWLLWAPSWFAGIIGGVWITQQDHALSVPLGIVVGMIPFVWLSILDRAERKVWQPVRDLDVEIMTLHRAHNILHSLGQYQAADHLKAEEQLALQRVADLEIQLMHPRRARKIRRDTARLESR